MQIYLWEKKKRINALKQRNSKSNEMKVKYSGLSIVLLKRSEKGNSLQYFETIAPFISKEK